MNLSHKSSYHIDTQGYSICLAVAVGIAAAVNWAVTHIYAIVAVEIAAIMFSVLAATFCQLWIAQIDDLKRLNNVKFEVLSEMAPRLSFGQSDCGPIGSYCPFVKEWEKIKKVDGLTRGGASSVVALKSTYLEYAVPRFFQITFVIVVLPLLFLFCTHWQPPRQSTIQAAGQTANNVRPKKL